jgi:hypothetical protein
LGTLSFRLGLVIICDCPQQGFLLGNRREWLVTFKYTIKVSPFISESDDLSWGRL